MYNCTVHFTVPPLLQLEPHKVNTPSPGRSPRRSPGRSPSQSRSLNVQRKAEYLHLLEIAVATLLSQAIRYLVDPGIDPQDKQVLKKGLASELVSKIPLSCLQ